MTLRTRSNGEMVALDAARVLGVKLTDNGLANIAATLDTFATFQGAVHVNDQPVVDFVRDQLKAAPYWATAPASTTTTAADTSTMTRTEKAVATLAAARSDDGRAAIAREAHEAHGNPWRSSTFNRSRQGLIQNHDAVLAERLRREAAL